MCLGVGCDWIVVLRSIMISVIISSEFDSCLSSDCTVSDCSLDYHYFGSEPSLIKKKTIREFVAS